jgi:hypothetical protein
MAERHPPLPVCALGVLAVAWLAVTCWPSAAAAQTLEEPRHRQGYYLGGGIHFAATRITESDESLGIWPGNMFTFRTGEMLTTHLGLGIAAEYGGTQKGPEVAAFGGLSLEGQWEFATNLALHGGVGFATLGLVDRDHPDDPLRGSYGGVYSLALSYDIFPRKKRKSGGFALQPILRLSYLPDDPVSTTRLSLGLEFLRWRGLPKNQLDLPPGEGYEKSTRRRDR